VFLRRLPLALLAALVLGGCAAPGAPGNPTATPAAQALTNMPTEPPAPTEALSPTNVPTEPPASTEAPPPTPFPTPTVLPTAAPPATQTPPAPTAPPMPSAEPASAGGELLFLRAGDLWAFEIAIGKQRKLADGVRDFAVGPDRHTIALVRGEGRGAELWLIQRDGSSLIQLTRNNRAEATPTWAPDGSALVFGSAARDQPYAREWPAWSVWCVVSEVHLFNLAEQAESKLANGCDPSFSPDSKRVAFATPPTQPEQGLSSSELLTVNSIRLINRLGQNGWDFAKAAGADAPSPHTGRLLYAPAWSPDGSQIVYHRFLGYQALVDLDISQIAGSFKGGGQPVADGAGWLLPARFTSDGKTLAISENNFSDARGFGGYDNWSISVIRLEGTREIALPSGTITAVGQRVERLPRGQAAAWAPDGAALAVELPPGWRPDLPDDQPLAAGEQPGELWLWTPGRNPAQKLVEKVDFASPLAWLP
jgi:WD40-like Beta Propeller Repeat